MHTVDLDRTVTKTVTVVAAQDQVSNDLDGETVILDMKTGHYYGLDDIGTEIWEMVQSPRTVSEIIDVILDNYDVSPEQCEEDVISLLQNMVDEDILEILFLQI